MYIAARACIYTVLPGGTIDTYYVAKVSIHALPETEVCGMTVL